MKKYLLLILLLLFVSGCSSTNKKDDPVPSETKNFSIDVNMHEFFNEYNTLTKLNATYIYMGYYPQRLITDTNYINALNNITTTNEKGFIEYKGYEFFKVTVVNNHIYASASQSRDSVFTSGTGFEVGSVNYFLVEPILWKVLNHNESTNEYLLISEKILDAKPFNTSTDQREIDGKRIYPNNYEHSSIRNWLNNSFFNLCFTETEKSYIVPTKNKNESGNKSSLIQEVYHNDDTIDNVFLLSYDDIVNINYNFLPNRICDRTRYATATDLANANGLIKHSTTDAEGLTINSSIWMIRTNYEASRSAISYVGYDGFPSTEFYIDAPNNGIRPACTIKIN